MFSAILSNSLITDSFGIIIGNPSISFLLIQPKTVPSPLYCSNKGFRDCRRYRIKELYPCFDLIAASPRPIQHLFFAMFIFLIFFSKYIKNIIELLLCIGVASFIYLIFTILLKDEFIIDELKNIKQKLVEKCYLK